MIHVDDIQIKGKEFMKTYSDLSVYIEREGKRYVEAIDPIKYKGIRIYTETDIPIQNNMTEI